MSGQNYNYSAFGKLLSGQTATTAATNYEYTGQQFDSFSGLYDLRARYYNPVEGRFLSQDKFLVNLHNPKEINRYGYAAANPNTFYDPTGHQQLEQQTGKKSISEYVTIILSVALDIALQTIIHITAQAVVCVVVFDVTFLMTQAGIDSSVAAALAQNCAYEPCSRQFPTLIPATELEKIKPDPKGYSDSDKGQLFSSGYIYDTEEQAKKKLGEVIDVPLSNLRPGAGTEAESGPCAKGGKYEVGTHQTYYAGQDDPVASIVSCPCCVVDPKTHQAQRARKWAIVNLRESHLRDLYDVPIDW